MNQLPQDQDEQWLQDQYQQRKSQTPVPEQLKRSLNSAIENKLAQQQPKTGWAKLLQYPLASAFSIIFVVALTINYWDALEPQLYNPELSKPQQAPMLKIKQTPDREQRQYTADTAPKPVQKPVQKAAQEQQALTAIRQEPPLESTQEMLQPTPAIASKQKARKTFSDQDQSNQGQMVERIAISGASAHNTILLVSVVKITERHITVKDCQNNYYYFNKRNKQTYQLGQQFELTLPSQIMPTISGYQNIESAYDLNGKIRLHREISKQQGECPN